MCNSIDTTYTNEPKDDDDARDMSEEAPGVVERTSKRTMATPRTAPPPRKRARGVDLLASAINGMSSQQNIIQQAVEAVQKLPLSDDVLLSALEVVAQENFASVFVTLRPSLRERWLRQKIDDTADRII